MTMSHDDDDDEYSFSAKEVKTDIFTVNQQYPDTEFGQSTTVSNL